MLEREIVRDFGRKHGRWNGSPCALSSHRPTCLMTLSTSCIRGMRLMLSRSSSRQSGRSRRLAGHVPAFFIVPRRFVVDLSGGIEAGVESIVGKLKTFLNNERRVGVIEQVIVGKATVLNGVVNQPAQEGDIGAGANLEKEISGGGRPRQARIDHNHFGIAVQLRFNRPFETTGVVFRWIAAHDQHHVGVLDVDPAIGHRPASECWSQT